VIICEYCNVRPATHFCDGCKHWVCNSAACLLKASIAAAQRAGVAVAGVFRRG
jgi:hypothetical protein